MKEYKIEELYFTCTVCDNYGTLFGIAELNTQEDFEREGNDYAGRFGDHFIICIAGYCRKCGNLLIGRGWHDAGEGGNPYWNLEIIEPSSPQISQNLPEELKLAYASMSRLKQSDAGSYLTLARRFLELMTNDQRAKGKNLKPKLQNLKKLGVIPVEVEALAEIVGEYGDYAAHKNPTPLLETHALYVSELIEYFINYFYRLPHTLDEANKHLYKLKGIVGNRSKKE